jgi:hypothetical protein
MTWQFVRDVLLTGTGLALIISQIETRAPSSALIMVGLALTVPAAATHVAAVLSSGSPTPYGQPPSSPLASLGPFSPWPPPGSTDEAR